MPQENCFKVGDEGPQVPLGKITSKLPGDLEPQGGLPAWAPGFMGLLLEIRSLHVEAAGAVPFSEPQVGPGLPPHGLWGWPRSSVTLAAELTCYTNTTCFPCGICWGPSSLNSMSSDKKPPNSSTSWFS